MVNRNQLENGKCNLIPVDSTRISQDFERVGMGHSRPRLADKITHLPALFSRHKNWVCFHCFLSSSWRPDSGSPLSPSVPCICVIDGRGRGAPLMTLGVSLGRFCARLLRGKTKKNSNRQSETLASLGIIRTQLRASFKPLNLIVL